MFQEEGQESFRSAVRKVLVEGKRKFLRGVWSEFQPLPEVLFVRRVKKACQPLPENFKEDNQESFRSMMEKVLGGWSRKFLERWSRKF